MTRFNIPVLVAYAIGTLASPTPTPTAAQGTAKFSCTAPDPVTRPICQSTPAGSFYVQVGKCGSKFDGLYYVPIHNDTSGDANPFPQASPNTGSNGYLYPPTFTYGPWAWAGSFAGYASSPVQGLDVVTWTEAEGSSNCAIQEDLKPFNCGKKWYADSSSGELYAAGSEVVAEGFEELGLYIVQSCSS